MTKYTLKGKQTRVTSPFDTSSHKTERTANQKIVQWINQIIKERNLPLGIAEQETVGADRKQPDIVIFESTKSERVLCFIELEQPYFSPFDEKRLKNQHWKKQIKEKLRYTKLQVWLDSDEFAFQAGLIPLNFSNSIERIFS